MLAVMAALFPVPVLPVRAVTPALSMMAFQVATILPVRAMFMTMRMSVVAVVAAIPPVVIAPIAISQMYIMQSVRQVAVEPHGQIVAWSLVRHVSLSR